MSYYIRYLLALLRAPLHAVSFAIRQRLRLRRPVAALRHESKDTLFAYLEGPAREQAEARASILTDEYALWPLAAASTQLVFRDNLYWLDRLASLSLHLPQEKQVRVLEVGPASWHYVVALGRFFQKHTASFTLTGVELDAYALSEGLHTRIDLAEARIAQLGCDAIDYQSGDFLSGQYQGYDLVLLFFPFLSRYPLLQWGLPLRFCQPARLIEKATRALQPGGLLLVWNQTEEEQALLLSLLPLGVEVVEKTALTSNLVDYAEAIEDRRATLLRVGRHDVRRGDGVTR